MFVNDYAKQKEEVINIEISSTLQFTYNSSRCQ